MNMELQAYLKIKHVSLADEIKRIKKEYKKHAWASSYLENDEALSRSPRYWDHYKTYTGLKNHYEEVVYVEVRATQLARAYFKGLTYEQCEPGSEGVYWNVLNRLYELVAKYEDKEAYRFREKRRKKEEVKKEVDEWINASLLKKEAA